MKGSLTRGVAMLLALLMVPMVAGAQAPTGRLVGKVVDGDAKLPIGGARIEVVGSALRTNPNVDGRYVLRNVPVGVVTLKVSMIGYAPTTVTGIRITADSVSEQDISLGSLTVELQELTVTAAVAQGSVNAALDEQRNSVGIINAVSSYHTDFSRYTEAYGVPRLRGPVQRYLSRFHRRSARVYTPGLQAQDELAALGVTAVEVWGRGVDTELFHPRHRDRGSIAGPEIDDDTFVFLHVGRLAAEKGVERILQAYDRARIRLPAGQRSHLIIAGDGPARAALREAAGPGVTFLGNLDRQRVLPRLYASADAFLFASHTETLGLVILEAMASGVPVIAAPAGGVADHLRHDENGLAYPPGDVEAMAAAMVAMVENPVRRAALAAGARQTAERLSWEEELDRLSESYRERVPGVAIEGEGAARPTRAA